MNPSQKQLLDDINTYPTDEVVYSIIGENKTVWEKIMNYALENYPAGTGVWKYYNDGKQWLFRFILKKKTIFWISLLEGTFRITFYLGSKAESLMAESTVSDKVKSEFLSRDFSGHFRPVTIMVKGTTDLYDIRTLIDLKAKQK